MKTLLKELPTKKDIKDFYNFNTSKNYKVNKVNISSDFIILDCIIINDKKTIIPSFYQEINFINFNKKIFSIIIKNEYYHHLIKNIDINLKYIKTL